MKQGIFAFFIILFSSNFLFGQTINPKKLDDEISSLNNKHLYEKSILKLQEILDNPDASHYDKYNAYLQKYYTYKRVSDFTTALENIELAKKEGILSNKKEECLSKIAIEDIFMKIEIQEFAEVKKILPEAQKKINLKLLDPDTQGFYLCTLEIIENLDKKYKEADKHLDQAIAIFKKNNPRHLPNVYRKKIDIYKAIGNREKVIDAYNKGIYYAKKYNVRVYEKGLYESMAQYYRENYNPKLIEYYLNLSAKTAIASYKSLNESEKLKRLELKILADKEKEKEKYALATFSVTFIFFTLLTLYLFSLNKHHKKKRFIIQQENQKILSELQLVMKEKQTDESNLQLKEQELSDRQLQILELIKKGKTNKEIASELYISENTVKYHLKIIYNILDIENRFQLKK
jgi:DNA-binding CsgD family transcriptional regulator